MSSQLGGVVVWWPIFFLVTTKITVGKGSVGKYIVHHGKLKPYKHTFNEEYDIDKIGKEKVNFFLKSSFCPKPDGSRYEKETLNVPFKDTLLFREVQSHCPTLKPAEYMCVYIYVCVSVCVFV